MWLFFFFLVCSVTSAYFIYKEYLQSILYCFIGKCGNSCLLFECICSVASYKEEIKHTKAIFLGLFKIYLIMNYIETNSQKASASPLTHKETHFEIIKEVVDRRRRPASDVGHRDYFSWQKHLGGTEAANEMKRLESLVWRVLWSSLSHLRSACFHRAAGTETFMTVFIWLLVVLYFGL